jgi:hypothetical protein
MTNRSGAAWHLGHWGGGCWPRTASPHTWHTHSVVSSTTTSPRLTIPASRW